MKDINEILNPKSFRPLDEGGKRSLMQASERIRENLKRRKDNTPEPKRSIWREEIALGSEKLALLVEKEAQTKA